MTIRRRSADGGELTRLSQVQGGNGDHLLRAQELGSNARARLLQAQENRAQKQLEAAQKPAPTYYDGQGRIKPLGANSGIRARGIQTNAPLGVGDRVSDNGGLVQATPRTVDNSAEIQQLRLKNDRNGALIREALQQQKILLIPGDINAETEGEKDTPGRFINDIALATSYGILYFWSGAQWNPIAPLGVPNDNGDPRPGDLDLSGAYDGQLYYDRGRGVLWRWDADLLGDPPSPFWIAESQLLQGFGGAPDNSICFIDGAIAVNNSGTVFVGTIAGGWTELSAGGGGGAGLVLNGYMSQLIARNSSATLDWSGLDESRDDAAYWDISDPEAIYLPSTGIYRLSLSVALPYASNTTNQETIWTINIRQYRVADDTLVGLSDYQMSRHTLSGPSSTVETIADRLNDSVVMTVAETGVYLTIAATNQTTEAGSSFDFGGFANNCTLTIEKLS